QLHSTAGSFRAEQIIVCSGHDYQTLLADAMAELNPSICRLQMLRARPAVNLNLQHALLTGLSCVHYGAFADLPEAAAVQAQILRDAPHLHEH
ncbi:TIGR03364 family FAD-dependent oxidoreductase, partial [Klebsiella pneumoniae]|nr:TIGR03364 family FAD-dependent oxidoreductase [Klebsiella pneumoniae]